MFHEYKDSLPILRNIVPGATRDQMYSICEGMVDPKVVLRNGSVVHRNKVTNIPEGYLGDERSN